MIAVFQHRSTVDCTYLISFVPFVSVKGKFIMKKSLLVAALIAVALSACGKTEAPVEAASAVVEAASAVVEAASAVVEAAPVASEAAASEASAAK
ncbi:hypothetical protein ACFQNF_19765 [Iodobacter arcticus]|uniref:Lipoprotein n=2 Tax=Betaproteobacteria TaxID=28216 RepID=A0ABW2R6K6_9NEIS